MRTLSKIDDWEIIEALGKAKNQADALRILDVNTSGGSRRLLREFIKNHNVNTDNFEKKLSREEYEQNPKLCKHCGKPISWENRLGEFCSRSCVASETNKTREISEETRKKISESLQKRSPNFDGIIKPIQERNRISSSKEKHYCLFCGNELKKGQTKFCSNECQVKYQRDKYIEKWKQGLEDGLSGEYGLSSHIRNYLLEKHNHKCELCGWGEMNPYTNTIPLEIHHKDGNYLNNSEDNLQVLCPNCHALTETIKSHNKTGRKGRKRYYKNDE